MSNPGIKKPLILIIEDNPSDLRLLSSLIEDQANVIFATSGSHGLKQTMTQHPDLILLDVELPDMDGYAVCAKIKSEKESREIPIIFVTGHTSSNYEVSALEAGAVDFITKPFIPPIICARVKTHLTLKHQTDLLHSLAEKDGLTGVFNRRHFDNKSEDEWRRHLRQAQPLAVAMIDVDLFKQFNDLYGHTSGDECLKSIANCLAEKIRRPGEFVARYGGEEFVCLLPNTQIEEATRFGDYICRSIANLSIDGLPKSSDNVTISVGVSSTIPQKNETMRDLLNRADSALYKAKASGRNCCRHSDT